MAPATTDPDDYRRVREVLAAANYTDEGVVKTLGLDTLNRLQEKRIPVLLRRTGGGTPLETLIRLFILGQPVEMPAARVALAPMTPERWAEIGLIEIAASGIRALVQLRCFQGLVLAFDFTRRGPRGLRGDYVMGVSPSSLVLAGMTVRRKNHAALDLGSGCGIEAFLAARHSRQVVAVDYNPRAVAVTRFNSALNQVDNVECRQGDMFEPVAGEAFDLIVSNPPFIISPDHGHMFLNSGTEGDEACRRIVKEAPNFLEEGGYCVFNANWEVVEGEDWRSRLAGWFEGSGCDGLVLHHGTKEPAEYAAMWIETESEEPAEFQRAFDRWMSYYAAGRISGLAAGVIVMRRASRRVNWFATDAAPPSVAVQSGDDVERLVEARSFLHSLSHPGDLLEARLKLAPNVRLEQLAEREAGSWRTISARLLRVGGLEYVGKIDGPGAAMLARCDGSRPIRAHLQELAAELGTDMNTLAGPALEIIRRLLEQGFLVSAGREAKS
jgi:SAM-dependent methyltransferase